MVSNCIKRSNIHNDKLKGPKHCLPDNFSLSTLSYSSCNCFSRSFSILSQINCTCFNVNRALFVSLDDSVFGKEGKLGEDGMPDEGDIFDEVLGSKWLR